MGDRLMLWRKRWHLDVSVVETKAHALATPLAWVHGGVSGLDPNLAQLKLCLA